MKHKNILLSTALGLAILLWVGCGKSGVDCMNNTGAIIIQERTLPAFDSIEVNDYVNVFISQDTLYSVLVEAGKNIIGGIETTVNSGNLQIGNNNSCNWIRSYNKPINVYIRTPRLLKIYYNSSGNLSTLNTLTGDSLKLEVWGGCGTISLDLNIYSGSFALQIGTSDIHLTGICGIVSMYTGDFGLIDARNLSSGYAYIANKSSNDCYIQVHQELRAKIQSIGNIYYTGNPKEIQTTIIGSGSVIPF